MNFTQLIPALFLSVTICLAQRNFVSALPDLLQEAEIIVACEIDEARSVAERKELVVKPVEIFRGSNTQDFLVFTSSVASSKETLDKLKGKRLLLFGVRHPGSFDNPYRLLTADGSGLIAQVAYSEKLSFRKLIPSTVAETTSVRVLKEVASLNYFNPTSEAGKLLFAALAISEARSVFIELMDIYAKSPNKRVWETGVSNLIVANGPQAIQIVDALAEAKDPAAERWLKAIEMHWKRSNEPETRRVFLRWFKDSRAELRRTATVVFGRNVAPADLHMMAQATYDSDVTVRKIGMSALSSSPRE